MDYFEETQLSCRSILNIDRFPIDLLNSDVRQEIVNQVRADLAEDGCAVLRNFFSPQGLNALLSEAQSRYPDAYYSRSKHCNVYLGDGNPNEPKDHPQNIFLERTNGFVTADTFSQQTASYRLYHWAPLRQFLADCLSKKMLHIYADPVSNMIVNVGRPGQIFNWHFDTNEFTITMLLQAADSGGRFEYAPNIRTSRDECIDNVKKVLDGDHRCVKQLELNPGDLQFFLGRYSMHRVTKNTGKETRLLQIMSFTEQPNIIGSLYRVKDLYGKVTDAHFENEGHPNRGDRLLD